MRRPPFCMKRRTAFFIKTRDNGLIALLIAYFNVKNRINPSRFLPFQDLIFLKKFEKSIKKS